MHRTGQAGECGVKRINNERRRKNSRAVDYTGKSRGRGGQVCLKKADFHWNVVALIFLKVNSIFIALVSSIIGWSIAERNALRHRVNLWPKLERCLSWDAICERLSM